MEQPSENTDSPVSSTEETRKPSSSEPSSPLVPTPEPTPEPIIYGGGLELPVTGASGYAAVSLNLRQEPVIDADVLMVLELGQGFTILEESGDWWQILIGEAQTGWVSSAYCLINLPNAIPSIIYDNTNTYTSIFKSSWKEIPRITEQVLYTSISYN